MTVIGAKGIEATNIQDFSHRIGDQAFVIDHENGWLLALGVSCGCTGFRELPGFLMNWSVALISGCQESNTPASLCWSLYRILVSTVPMVYCLTFEWKRHCDSCSISWRNRAAFDGDCSSMFFNKLPSNPKSNAGAKISLGTEKRFEYPSKIFRCDFLSLCLGRQSRLPLGPVPLFG